MKKHLTPLELNEHLDGALTPDRESAAREHLASCAACSRAHEGLSAAVTAFTGAKTPRPSAGFDRRVLAALAKQSSPLPAWGFGVLGTASAAWIGLLAAATYRLLDLPAPSEWAPAAEMLAARGVLWTGKVAPLLGLILSTAKESTLLLDLMQKLCVAALLAAPIIVSLARAPKLARTWRIQ